MQEENNKNNVIICDFKSEAKIQTKKPVKTFCTQTNPIEKLLKLTHTEISKHKDDYNSFSKFKPEDLI